MLNIYIIIKKKIVYSLDFWKKGYRMMQNIFTNIKCSEIILYNANENWYIILYDLFSRLCYILRHVDPFVRMLLLAYVYRDDYCNILILLCAGGSGYSS